MSNFSEKRYFANNIVCGCVVMKKYIFVFVALVFFAAGCTKSSKEKDKKGYLQIAFKSASNSFQLLRHMAVVPSGGADIGECLYVAEQIKEEDFLSWYNEWSKAANRILDFSATALKNKDVDTAGRCLLRSCNYFLAAEFFLPRGHDKLKVFEKARECFVKASEIGAHSFKKIEIPYENSHLPGYIYIAKSPKPAKTIILNTGYDGSAEELYFAIGYFAQRRGYNVIIFEGPGQGMLLRQQDMPFVHDWENVMKVVVDFALSFKEVDPNRLALYGLSFGGYLAPRAAAHERRIKALIVNSPIYDFLSLVAKHGLPVEAAMEHPHDFDKAIISEMERSPKIKHMIEDGMWKMGSDTPSGFVKTLSKYKLDDEPILIECPTLVVDSVQDSIVDRDQAKIFYEKLKCPKEMILFTDETGAALHCQVGSCFYSNEVIFGWLDKVLK